MVSFLGLLHQWEISGLDRRMYNTWKFFRDTRIFRVPSNGSLEDAMKFAMRMQTRGVFDSGEFVNGVSTNVKFRKLYTKQHPLVIKITGNQQLKGSNRVLKIYGDFVRIIGNEENGNKPIVKGSFSFVNTDNVRNHITIKNLVMDNGHGCTFKNATVTMDNVNVINSDQSGVRVENGDIALNKCLFINNGSWGLNVKLGSVIASHCNFEGNRSGGVRLQSFNSQLQPKFSEFKHCICRGKWLENLRYGLSVQGNVYLWQCDIDKIYADIYRSRSWTSTTIFKYGGTIPEAFLDEEETERNPNLILKNESIVINCSETVYNIKVHIQTNNKTNIETKTDTKLRR